MGVRDKLSKVGLDTSASSFRLGGRTKASSVNLAADRDAKSTTQAVNNAIGNGDVMLVDTRQVYFRRPVTRSAINIYNPRKVEIAGGAGSSKDQTTEAEKREEELEARRRRRRMALLTGGAAGGAAAAASAGGGDGGDAGGETEEEESLLDSVTDAAAIVGGASLFKGVIKRLFNFRKSLVLRGAGMLASSIGLRGARTPKTTAPSATPRTTGSKPVFDPKVNRFRDPTTGRFTKAPSPTVKPTAASRLGSTAKAVGTGLGRGAGMVTKLAGGPVGIGLIAAELAAAEYLRRLQESTGAQNVANASHALREGNAFYTNDGQKQLLGEFSDDDPGYVRSIVQERANLIQNTLTIVGAVKSAKEAFLLDDDGTASMYLKSLEPLTEARAKIAGRLGGVMMAENMISSPGQLNILGRLSPGSVGGIDFNIQPGLDQELQRDIETMKKSLSFFEVFDKQTVDSAKSQLQTTDVDLILEEMTKRRQQYESAKAAQGIEPTPTMTDVAPPTNFPFPTAPVTGQEIGANVGAASPPIIINNQSTSSPPLPDSGLSTRGDEARDIRDNVIGNGQMTGNPGLD